MIKLLQNDPEELLALYNGVSKKMNISAIMVEKDLWVSYFLDYLFSRNKYQNYYVFKGGTSLSKCYHLIERFSEDLDILLSPAIFGIDLNDIINKKNSRNQNEKFIEMIDKKAMDFIENIIIKTILGDVKKELGIELIIEIDKEDLCFYIYYPTIVKERSYIKPAIKVEMSCLSAIIPTERKIVSSYIGELYPHLFESPSFSVNSLAPERTFWEKLLILHQEAHRVSGNLPDRYSRHYYDVVKIYLSDYGERAIKNLALLEDVRIFTITFYNRRWASFDTAKPGSFLLIPGAEYINELEKDYHQMNKMIFAKQVVTFDEILKYLQEIEDRLNNL